MCVLSFTHIFDVVAIVKIMYKLYSNIGKLGDLEPQLTITDTRMRYP